MANIVEKLFETAGDDVDLLRKIDALGDDSSIPREVEFFLYAPSEEQAQLVASFINDLHYGRATAESHDEHHRIKVLIDMPITQNVLGSVSGLMAVVAFIFKVEYDGWESDVKRRS